MHNDIMAVGSKERPSMLAMVQLDDTPSDDENLRKPGEVVEETYANTSPEKLKLIDAEAEAVYMILNGIGNEMYLIMDACTNAKEMWIAIECLQ
uniref:Uncharacterized protein n=1 Tax=Tanacetum cinerariifolium TaxID=118510 RepID=A0A6L2MFF9_TANCI|nr:hypothetical protein [Tanacetum cinerariifolium]